MMKTEVKDNNAPNSTGAVERYFRKSFIIDICDWFLKFEFI